ncbi:MAG: extracellular solute-binding protein [Oscillospiraceae bacterium]|nr:extracellular solute-binding protein [Oscillospiraceae bacterium]
MKKLVTILTVLMFILSLAGCAAGDDDTSGGNNQAGNAVDPGNISVGNAGTDSDTVYTLKVWASQEDQTLMQEFADKFIAGNPQYKVTIELGVVGEPDAYARYSEDPAAAADVFFFPNDQLRDFVSAGGLYEVTRNKEDIIARNGVGSVGSATLDGKLYGYPMTADNGYFLYYDKSVLSEEDVKSLDRILEVSAAAGKKVLMNLYDNGWYCASFFLGAGCTLTISADGKQICDFNNANGLAAAKAMYAFTGHPAYINGEDDVLKGGIGGTLSAGVSGTWNAEDIASILGSNYGASKLPTFTMDGKQVQMGSFGGYKLAGINSMITEVEKLVIAMDFADFVTNEENQLIRFSARAMGPSNTNAASNPAVIENTALAALAAQSAYATSQNDVLASFWPPAGAFGTAMVNQDGGDIQALLDNMVAQIQS